MSTPPLGAAFQDSGKPTGAVGQPRKMLCRAGGGNGTGRAGVGAQCWLLLVAGAQQGQQHKAQPQGFADPGQTKRGKKQTCLLDIFPLQIMISAGSACLQRISRKEKKHTHTHTENGFVQIENKKLPDVPCSSLPAPSKKYWQEMGKGSQKTFEEKY